MKINLTQIITNRENVQVSTKVKVPKIIEKDGEMIEEYVLESRIPTLGFLIENALLQQDLITPQEIEDRYNLFNKIKSLTEVELDEKEISLVKELVAKRYDTFTAGKMFELINNNK